MGGAGLEEDGDIKWKLKRENVGDWDVNGIGDPVASPGEGAGLIGMEQSSRGCW
jgi:hypothetical protein